MFKPLRVVISATTLIAFVFPISSGCRNGGNINGINAFEECMRTELKRRENFVSRANVSRLSEYADIWSQCAKEASSAFCKTDGGRNSEAEWLLFHFSNLWNQIDKLMDAWREKGNYISNACEKNLRYDSAQICLPMISAYLTTSTEANLKVINYFVDCISSVLKDCANDSQQFFADVIKKNILSRFYVSENGDPKECLELLNEEEVEKCAPGLFRLLDDLTKGNLIIERKVKVLPSNKCVTGHFKQCDLESLEALNHVTEVFLDAPLFSRNEKTTLKATANFYLRGGDRSQILDCLKRSKLCDIDDCVPELVKTLEVITKEETLNTTELRYNSGKGRGCLGNAFKTCSGSMRYVIKKVILALNGLDLKIPFDTNSLLSTPGLFEFHLMELLFPPYRMNDQMAEKISHCFDLAKMDLFDCCGNVTDAIASILKNQSLPFPLKIKRFCEEPCVKQSTAVCDEDDRPYIEKLIFAVKEAYKKIDSLKMNEIPISPPYAISETVLKNLTSCLEDIDESVVKNCCPGIISVAKAFAKNQTLPPRHVSSERCEFECILHATEDCDPTSASVFQGFVALAIKRYENWPSSFEVFRAYTRLNGNAVSSKSSNNVQAMNKKQVCWCLRNISKDLDLCCPSLTAVLLRTIKDKPLSDLHINPKNCSVFCFEPSIAVCERPDLILSQIQSILKEQNVLWEDNFQFIIFPEKPPYNLPKIVLGAINLCIRMAGSELKPCCDPVFDWLNATLFDEPVFTKALQVRYTANCYDIIRRNCFQENADISISLIESLINYEKIRYSIKMCLEKVKNDLEKCCPSLQKTITLIFNGQEWQTSANDIRNCSDKCFRMVLKQCEHEGSSTLMKTIKYIKDYGITSDAKKIEDSINLPAPVEDIVSKCIKSVLPILQLCCSDLVGAAYSVINKEPWPLDFGNLKRCSHSCFESAIKSCSPEDSEKTLKFMNDIYLQPALELKGYHEKCTKIIVEALKGCCVEMVLNVYKNLPVPQTNVTEFGRCSNICKENILRSCITSNLSSADATSLIEMFLDSESAFLKEVQPLKNLPHFSMLSDDNLANSELYLPQGQYLHGNTPKFDSGFNLPLGAPEGYFSQNWNTRSLSGSLKSRMKRTIEWSYYNFRSPEMKAFISAWKKFHVPYSFRTFFPYNEFQIEPLKKKREISHQFRSQLLYSGNTHLRRTREKFDISDMKKPSEPPIISLNPSERIARIPSFLKKKARICVDKISKTNFEECCPGLYNAVSALANGIKPIPLSESITSMTRLCLNEIFEPCSMDSVLVINDLLQHFLGQGLSMDFQRLENTSIHEPMNEHVVKACLNKIKMKELERCSGGLSVIILEALENGNNRICFPMNPVNGKCLGEVFGVCSMMARLNIMKIMLPLVENFVEIPLILDPGHVDVLKLIPEKDIIAIKQCLWSLDEERIKACDPDLHHIFSELVDGSLGMEHKSLKTDNRCLKGIFSICSVHSRLLIMDLVKFVTQSFINIPLQIRATRHLISGEEKALIEPCVHQLNASLLDVCLPGLYDAINDIYENDLPNVKMISAKIGSYDCLKDSFSNCKPRARVLLTELLYQFTNGYVNLLFANPWDAEENSEMKDVVESCLIYTLNNTDDQSLSKLSGGLSMLADEILSSTGMKLEKKFVSNCNKILKNCTLSQRVLIDEILRNRPFELNGSSVFDVSQEFPVDTGLHEHSHLDQSTIKQCFDTLSENAMESCVPGLYETMKSLTNSTFPLKIVSLKPVKTSCLEGNFAACAYHARLLIMDLLYDLSRILLYIPRYHAPEGSSGLLGPPTAVIQNCISSIDHKAAEDCAPGLINFLKLVFIKREEKITPLVSRKKMKTVMPCLNELLRYCELQTEMFILKRVAEISKIKLNIQFETRFVQKDIDDDVPEVRSQNIEGDSVLEPPSLPTPLRKFDASNKNFLGRPLIYATHSSPTNNQIFLQQPFLPSYGNSLPLHPNLNYFLGNYMAPPVLQLYPTIQKFPPRQNYPLILTYFPKQNLPFRSPISIKRIPLPWQAPVRWPF